MNVGDRVTHESFGKGRVIIDGGSHNKPIGVEFDDPHGGLWNLDGKCPSGRGWWCKVEELELVREHQMDQDETLHVGDRVEYDGWGERVKATIVEIDGIGHIHLKRDDGKTGSGVHIEGYGNAYTVDRSRLTRISGGQTMETLKAPETKLEKSALAEAKKQAIETAIKTKAEEYKAGMAEYIKKEREALRLRNEADALAKTLGITEAERKDLF